MCKKPEGHADNPNKPVPKVKGKPGPKPKGQRNGMTLDKIGDLLEPKKEPAIPKLLDEFRITRSNAVPAAVPTDPALVAPMAMLAPAAGQQALPSDLLLALQVVTLLRNGALAPQLPAAMPAAPPAILNSAQPVVSFVSAAAVANKIFHGCDAAREVGFLEQALAEQRKRGQLPPENIEGEPLVQAAADEYVRSDPKKQRRAAAGQGQPAQAPLQAAPPPPGQQRVNPAPVQVPDEEVQFKMEFTEGGGYVIDLL